MKQYYMLAAGLISLGMTLAIHHTSSLQVVTLELGVGCLLVGFLWGKALS
jgi:hypothetical protein